MPSEQTDELTKILSDFLDAVDRLNEEGEGTYEGCIAEARAAIVKYEAEARYDPNRLGTYVFVGDADKLKNFDDLYWSYVLEYMAEYDPYTASHQKNWEEFIKSKMRYASFGEVGIFKQLARADQRAKERIAQLAAGEGKHE
jgi:hypothetical protein